MRLPLAYLDTAVIEEVQISVWKEVFDVTGWPSALASKRDSFAHEDILPALQDNPSDDLLQALETLHNLGTEVGREAIVLAMNNRHIPVTSLPPNASEREFALRLYLAQRSNASMADVFARAQIQVQEAGEHRRYNEFMGKDSRSVTNLEKARKKLHEEVIRHCRENDLGDHVQAQAFEDDGAYVFNVLRSDRTKKPLAVVRGHTARATIEYRPVHCDLLQYDSSIGRLRIAARAASIVDFYRSVFGKVLFDDEFFFDGDPVCSLRVLQDRGRDALQDHGVFGVGRVWMTECLWERGDRNLLQIRSQDCFRSIEDLRLPLTEGQLIQAKLKLEVIGKSTRPVTVNIRVPSRIEVSRRTDEYLVDKVLNAIGIRNTAPASGAIGFWSLYPWRHPVAVWRTVFGSAMDSLVRAGVLKSIQMHSAPHPEYPGAGRPLQAHPVSDGEFYGVSNVEEIPSRSLSATDLDGLELVPENFRLHLRSVLGISSSGTRWDEQEQDLLHLGIVDVSGQRIYLAYVLRQPGADIGDRLRARADGAHPVLLVPPSQSAPSDLAKVILESPIPELHQVIRNAIQVCGFANVTAIHSAPDGARLVVDTICKKVWIDGVEIGGLQADSHAFKLIELMARASMPVSHDEITANLSAGRQDENTVARQAKTAARKTIREAMTAAGRTFDDDPFPSAGTGFYRCTLPAYVR